MNPQQQPQGPLGRKIEIMFRKVAPRYDLANTVLSFGVHHLWRSRLVKLANVEPGSMILDCATGTGDLAIEFKKAVGASGKVFGTDFCKEMLERAPQKAHAEGLEIFFSQQDVTALPYEDNSFDVVSIAFGIRNVENPHKGLSEMLRVLKPGGRLMVLEFSKVWKPLERAYDLYSFKVLPWLGDKVAGDADAYRYLADSIRQHPDQATLAAMLRDAGLSKVEVFNLAAGVVAIHRGYRF
jgi:demethylmenaquinone methyltransferase/2-methoxy-6-polyprenyl-1,4-benzoquinol methylase